MLSAGILRLNKLGNNVCQRTDEDQGQHNCKVFKEGFSDEKIARIDNSFDLASHYRNARLG